MSLNQILNRTEMKFALGYFAPAIVLLLFFGLGHVAGLRESVSILADPLSGRGDLAAGIYYVVTWLGATLLAPIFAGAGVLAGLLGLIRGRGAPG